MKQFDSVDDILNFAIKNEEESAVLYGDLAKKMENPGTRKFFAEMAAEEVRHKAKLLDIKSGKKLEASAKKVMDLKLSDYLVDVKLDDILDYRKALVFAMKAEKAEFSLYMDLSERTSHAEIRDVLVILAQEEAKHKLKLEIEYDEYILRES
ncbi:MAG: ferritin family protein [Candidatus Brocadiia bacterium]